MFCAADEDDKTGAASSGPGEAKSTINSSRRKNAGSKRDRLFTGQQRDAVEGLQRVLQQ